MNPITENEQNIPEKEDNESEQQFYYRKQSYEEQEWDYDISEVYWGD